MSEQTLDKARRLTQQFIDEFQPAGLAIERVYALLDGLAKHPEPGIDPLVRSNLSMILNDHLWQYWYYDGIPLAVRIAYWAAVEAGLYSVPDEYAHRWLHFCEHLKEHHIKKRALDHSELAGGWLFPGEAEALWEIVRLAASVEGDVCELGSWSGRSATIWCAATQQMTPDKRVILVDNWAWGNKGDLYPFMTEGRDVLLEMKAQLEPYRDQYRVVQGDILEKLPEVKANMQGDSLSVLFHDAAHDYESVSTHLQAYLPLLAPGGFLVVHDYNQPDDRETLEAVHVALAAHEDIHRFSVFNTLGIFRRMPEKPRPDLLHTLGADRTIEAWKDDTEQPS